MSRNTFYIDKATGTFADALSAFGMGVVLHNVLQNCTGHSDVRITDDGAYYRVITNPEIADEWLGSCEPFMPAPYLRTLDKKSGRLHALPTGLKKVAGAVVDYEAEKQKRAEYFAARERLGQELKRAERQPRSNEFAERLVGLEPHRDWDIFRAINPGGLVGYNGLVESWWSARDKRVFPQLLRILLDLFSVTPNDIADAQAQWACVAKQHGLSSNKATALQIFNPHQGKGQNRGKADALSMGNVDGFWLVEWLKAVGMYRAGLTRQLRGSKDRKSYVLAPHKLSLEHNDRIMEKFKGSMAVAETATRSDILAAIRYVRAFLEYCDERPDTDLFARLMGGASPRDFVSGMYSAFYKNLGNSPATMNLAFIALPGWVIIRSPEDIKRFADTTSGVLTEHEAIVRQLDESHGDEFELLRKYRDFLSGNDLGPFLELCVAYGSYVMRQRERRGGRARQFTTNNLEVLIMNSEPRLQGILASPGFQNVAYAIRHSTVVPQYQKARSRQTRALKPLYDIRYGLGQQLARKAAYPKEFVAELANFLQKYNAENSQVREDLATRYPGGLPDSVRYLLRKDLRTSDIDEIVGLIDQYGDSRLVCNLLVAYGYAREPRAGEREDASPPLDISNVGVRAASHEDD